MRGLQGKGVLVAGASRGIGEAAARRFLEEGCRVFICARGAAGVEAVPPAAPPPRPPDGGTRVAPTPPPEGRGEVRRRGRVRRPLSVVALVLLVAVAGYTATSSLISLLG